MPVNHLGFLSYRLKGANGGKNGIVILQSVMSPGPGESWSGVPIVDGKAVARGNPVSQILILFYISVVVDPVFSI